MDATEVAQRLVGALEAAGVPYAIGGAIAYGFFGAPRGTYDVDLNLFIAPEEATRALSVLRSAGLEIDEMQARASALERGDAKGHFQNMPVDLFFNSIPLHESAAGRTKVVTLLGSRVRVLSPEDIAVFKLLFFRGKDISDIERLLGLMGTLLDRDQVGRAGGCDSTALIGRNDVSPPKEPRAVGVEAAEAGDEGEPLPEGQRVTIVLGDDAAWELDETSVQELVAAAAEADREEGISAEQLFAELRAAR